MSSPIVQNIDRSALPENQRNGLAILEHLSVADLNQIKDVLKLSNPGVIGPQTLTAFVTLAGIAHLDLSNAGVNTFKNDHGLGNTGPLAGVIGTQTASAYFDAVIAAVQPADEGISPDGFCPFAIRDDQDAHDGGTFIGGPPRGVLHTTEGATFAGARGAFLANNTWPHFTITNETGTVVAHQHLPITVGARTLEHRPNTVDTNRRTAIQIEIVGAAASSQSFSPGYLAGIARLMRWIENHAGVARHASVSFAAPGQEQRLSDAAWVAYAGWCGHQHVPHNSHNDPGAIDIGTLLHGAPVVTPS